MNILCSVFGHKWDKSDKYRQNCKRKFCYVHRALMWNKYKTAIGEKAISWRVFK